MLFPKAKSLEPRARPRTIVLPFIETEVSRPHPSHKPVFSGASVPAKKPNSPLSTG